MARKDVITGLIIYSVWIVGLNSIDSGDEGVGLTVKQGSDGFTHLDVSNLETQQKLGTISLKLMGNSNSNAHISGNVNEKLSNIFQSSSKPASTKIIRKTVVKSSNISPGKEVYRFPNRGGYLNRRFNVLNSRSRGRTRTSNIRNNRIAQRTNLNSRQVPRLARPVKQNARTIANVPQRVSNRFVNNNLRTLTKIKNEQSPQKTVTSNTRNDFYKPIYGAVKSVTSNNTYKYNPNQPKQNTAYPVKISQQTTNNQYRTLNRFTHNWIKITVHNIHLLRNPNVKIVKVGENIYVREKTPAEKAQQTSNTKRIPVQSKSMTTPTMNQKIHTKYNKYTSRNVNNPIALPKLSRAKNLVNKPNLRVKPIRKIVPVKIPSKPKAYFTRKVNDPVAVPKLNPTKNLVNKTNLRVDPPRKTIPVKAPTKSYNTRKVHKSVNTALDKPNISNDKRKIPVKPVNKPVKSFFIRTPSGKLIKIKTTSKATQTKSFKPDVSTRTSSNRRSENTIVSAKSVVSRANTNTGRTRPEPSNTAKEPVRQSSNTQTKTTKTTIPNGNQLVRTDVVIKSKTPITKNNVADVPTNPLSTKRPKSDPRIASRKLTPAIPSTKNQADFSTLVNVKNTNSNANNQQSPSVSSRTNYNKKITNSSLQTTNPTTNQIQTKRLLDTVNQNTVNQNTVNHPTANHHTVNQNTVNQNTVNHLTVNQNTVNQHTVSRNTVNKNNVNQNTVNQNTVHQNNVNQKTTNHNTVNQNSVNHNTVNQNSVNQNNLNQTSVNQNTVNQYDVNKNKLNQNTVSQNTVNQNNLYQNTVNQNNLNQTSVNQYDVNQNNFNQKTVRQNTVNQNNVYQNTVNQNTVNQNTVNQNYQITPVQLPSSTPTTYATLNTTIIKSTPSNTVSNAQTSGSLVSLVNKAAPASRTSTNLNVEPVKTNINSALPLEPSATKTKPVSTITFDPSKNLTNQVVIKLVPKEQTVISNNPTPNNVPVSSVQSTITHNIPTTNTVPAVPASSNNVSASTINTPVDYASTNNVPVDPVLTNNVPVSLVSNNGPFEPAVTNHNPVLTIQPTNSVVDPVPVGSVVTSNVPVSSAKKSQTFNFPTEPVVPVGPVVTNNVPVGPVVTNTVPVGPVVTNNVPVGPVLTNNVPIGPFVTNNVPVGPLDANNVPVGHVVTNNVPVEPLVTNNVPVGPLVTNNVPVEPLVTNNVPVEPKVTNNVPVGPKVTNNVPVGPSVTNTVRVGPVVTNNVPVGPVLTNNVPIGPFVTNNVPVGPLDANNVPVEPLVTNNVPVGPLVTNNVPVEPLVTNNVPVEPKVTNNVPVGPFVTNNVPVGPFVTNNVPVGSLVTNNVPGGPVVTNNVPVGPVASNMVPVESATFNFPVDPVATNNVPAQLDVTNNVPVQPVMTINVPAQPVTTNNVPAQPAATNNVPAQPVATINVPAQPVTTNNVPAQPAASNNVPAQPAATINVPAQPAATNNVPAQPAAIINVLAQPAATINVPAQPVTTNNVPAQPAATNNVPAQPAATINVPAQPVTTNNVPSQPAATNNVPAQLVTINNVSAQPVATNNVPAQPVATNNVPAQPVVTNNVPAQPVATNNVSVQPVATNNVPAQAAATNNVPAQSVATNNVPAQPVVTNNVPAQPAATNNVPAQPVATNNVHVQPVVTNNVPAQPVAINNVPVQPVVTNNVPDQPVATNPYGVVVTNNAPAQLIATINVLAQPADTNIGSAQPVSTNNVPIQHVATNNVPVRPIVTNNVQIDPGTNKNIPVDSVLPITNKIAHSDPAAPIQHKNSQAATVTSNIPNGQKQPGATNAVAPPAVEVPITQRQRDQILALNTVADIVNNTTVNSSILPPQNQQSNVAVQPIVHQPPIATNPLERVPIEATGQVQQPASPILTTFSNHPNHAAKITMVSNKSEVVHTPNSTSTHTDTSHTIYVNKFNTVTGNGGSPLADIFSVGQGQAFNPAPLTVKASHSSVSNNQVTTSHNNHSQLFLQHHHNSTSPTVITTNSVEKNKLNVSNHDTSRFVDVVANTPINSTTNSININSKIFNALLKQGHQLDYILKHTRNVPVWHSYTLNNGSVLTWITIEANSSTNQQVLDQTSHNRTTISTGVPPGQIPTVVDPASPTGVYYHPADVAKPVAKSKSQATAAKVVEQTVFNETGLLIDPELANLEPTVVSEVVNKSNSTTHDNSTASNTTSTTLTIGAPTNEENIPTEAGEALVSEVGIVADQSSLIKTPSVRDPTIPNAEMPNTRSSLDPIPTQNYASTTMKNTVTTKTPAPPTTNNVQDKIGGVITSLKNLIQRHPSSKTRVRKIYTSAELMNLRRMNSKRLLFTTPDPMGSTAIPPIAATMPSTPTGINEAINNTLSGKPVPKDPVGRNMETQISYNESPLTITLSKADDLSESSTTPPPVSQSFDSKDLEELRSILAKSGINTANELNQLLKKKSETESRAKLNSIAGHFTDTENKCPSDKPCLWCRSSPAWSYVDGMTGWCIRNCKTQSCVHSRCKCKCVNADEFSALLQTIASSDLRGK